MLQITSFEKQLSKQILRHHASPRLPKCPHRVTTERPLLGVRYAALPTQLTPPHLRQSANHPLPACRAAPVAIDQVVSDFDGVTFHICTPESKSKIVISISVKCFPELVQYGAQDVLQREYGPYIVSPEAGYDFSIMVDLEQLPAEQGMTDSKTGIVVQRKTLSVVD